jgi:hypothetical protein
MGDNVPMPETLIVPVYKPHVDDAVVLALESGERC